MQLNLMVDIETLASTNDAAVIAIGTAIFDANEIIETQELLIDPRWAPGNRSLDTYLDFWMDRKKVSQAVFERMFSGTVLPWDAAVEWTSFVGRYDIKHAFANPPQFDFVILRSMYRMLDMSSGYPLHYRTERDCRTLFKIAEVKGIDLNSAYEGIDKHSAVSDAIAQAKAVQICRREGF